MQIKGSQYIQNNTENPLLENGILLSDCYLPAFEKQYIKRMSNFYLNAYKMENTGQWSIAGPLNCDIRVSYKNADFNEYSLTQLLMYLNSNTFGYTFSADLQDSNAQQELEYLSMSLQKYKIAAMGILFIVVFSNLGIAMVHFEQRKYSYAVAKAYGATNKRILCEIFSEFFLSNGIGAMLAVLVVYIFEPIISQIDVSVRILLGENLLFAIIFAVICSILPTIYVIFHINKIKILDTLKNY